MLVSLLDQKVVYRDFALSSFGSMNGAGDALVSAQCHSRTCPVTVNNSYNRISQTADGVPIREAPLVRSLRPKRQFHETIKLQWIRLQKFATFRNKHFSIRIFSAILLVCANLSCNPWHFWNPYIHKRYLLGWWSDTKYEDVHPNLAPLCFYTKYVWDRVIWPYAYMQTIFNSAFQSTKPRCFHFLLNN